MERHCYGCSLRNPVVLCVTMLGPELCCGHHCTVVSVLAWSGNIDQCCPEPHTETLTILPCFHILPDFNRESHVSTWSSWLWCWCKWSRSWPRWPGDGGAQISTWTSQVVTNVSCVMMAMLYQCSVLLYTQLLLYPVIMLLMRVEHNVILLLN